jgi:hypothetical protein
MIIDGNHKLGGDAPEIPSLLGTARLLSVVDSVVKNAIETFAAALNDRNSLSVSEEIPVESSRKLKQPSHRSNVMQRRKDRTRSSRQHVLGITGLSFSMAPSDATTKSSSLASADIVSTTSSESHLRFETERENEHVPFE